MATEKKMDQSDFGKISKELTAYAEIVRSRQDQKQIIMNDFNKERKRYKAGKISKKSLISSVPRVRKELQRLNNEIRKNIKNLQRTAKKTEIFAARQTPKKFKVSLSGISLSGTKRKKHRKHNRSVKKKSATRKKK